MRVFLAAATAAASLLLSAVGTEAFSATSTPARSSWRTSAVASDVTSSSSRLMIGGASQSQSQRNYPPHGSRRREEARFATYMAGDGADGGGDPDDIVGRRIIVKGDVNGGYVRTCIINEAGRFRRLIGTMSPPDDSNEAEVYVEGKRKMVDGFIRWCKKGDKSVGLSQKMSVKEVTDEVPTGLYDGFYVRVQEDN